MVKFRLTLLKDGRFHNPLKAFEEPQMVHFLGRSVKRQGPLPRRVGRSLQEADQKPKKIQMVLTDLEPSKGLDIAGFVALGFSGGFRFGSDFLQKIEFF